SRPEARHRDRRRVHGQRSLIGDIHSRAVATLSDARRAGGRRSQLPRLYGSVAISDQLVRAPPRLALSIAFSGVGAGSVIVLPWLQSLITNTGWRSACWALGIIVLGTLAPLNLLLKRRPEDLGLEPDGAFSGSGGATRTENIVDRAWAAVEWTLGKA